jgi:hypothetical protein
MTCASVADTSSCQRWYSSRSRKDNLIYTTSIRDRSSTSSIAGYTARSRKRDENQRHECPRRRPRQGASVLHRGARIREKTEIPLGEARWLTVVSPEDTEGTELLMDKFKGWNEPKPLAVGGIPASVLGSLINHYEAV